MSRLIIVVITAILLAIQASSMTANAKQLSARCWKSGDPIPQSVLLNVDKHGGLTWNGVSASWEAVQYYLADLPNTYRQGENFQVDIHPKIPHLREIEAILAKQGLQAQAPNCRVKVPAPPVFKPNISVY